MNKYHFKSQSLDPSRELLSCPNQFISSHKTLNHVYANLTNFYNFLQEEELKEIIATARDMELRWGHLFDMIIINNDTQRAYQQLLNEINSLEREPQWVPAHWLKQT